MMHCRVENPSQFCMWLPTFCRNEQSLSLDWISVLFIWIFGWNGNENLANKLTFRPSVTPVLSHKIGNQMFIHPRWWQDGTSPGGTFVSSLGSCWARAGGREIRFFSQMVRNIACYPLPEARPHALMWQWKFGRVDIFMTGIFVRAVKGWRGGVRIRMNCPHSGRDVRTQAH